MNNQTGNIRKIIIIGVISAIGIAIIAFLIVLASGYSAGPDEAGSASEIPGKLDAISIRLDRLEDRVNSLATESTIAEPPPPTSIRQPTPTTIRRRTPTIRPTNTQSARANEPTPNPITTATPLPAIIATGPGICSRSPRLQSILIDRLNLSSCQLITVHELFRVIELPELRFENSPQPGDFTGLVNVKELRIQLQNGSDLLPDTFHGLEGLETLRVELRSAEESDGKIEPGAFRGLSSILTLDLSWNRVTDERVIIPPFDHLQTLEVLQISIPEHLFALTEEHFQNLPHLRNLSMRMASRQGGVPRSLRLTQEIFMNNEKLENVEIHIDSGHIAVYADRDVFLQLDALKSLTVSTSSDIELSLSPNSPLLKDILNGNQYPQGYTVIPSGAN